VTYVIGQAIPHKVPRSACVFFPSKSDYEWRRLRHTDPQGWARDVEVDEALRRPNTSPNRGTEQAIYLHLSWFPLADVDLGEKDLSGGLAHSECEGMCGLRYGPAPSV
jgi:hypothetical protein